MPHPEIEIFEFSKETERFMSTPVVIYDTEPEREFDVKGAGKLILGKTPHSMCGGSVGFSLSWCDRPGGVLGRSEALRLANYIFESLKNVSEPEHIEYERRTKAIMPTK
jgi:hypothetical protein